MRDVSLAVSAHHRARERLANAREAADRQIAIVASCDEQIAAMIRLRDSATGSTQPRTPDDVQRFVQSLQAHALSGARDTLDQRYVPTSELKRMQAALHERAESLGRQYRRQLVRAEAERQHLEDEYRAAFAEYSAGTRDPPARQHGVQCAAATAATPEPEAAGRVADGSAKAEAAASPGSSSEYTSASSDSETNESGSASPGLSARPPVPPHELSR